MTVHRAWFLTIFAFAAAAGSAGADQLWQKSLDVFTSNTRWHPKHMLVHTDEYDELGNLKSTTYTEIEYSIDEEGELKSEILIAVKDGKDITDRQKRRRREESNPFLLSPFNPEFQKDIQVVPSGGTKTVEGRRCRGYRLSLEYEKNHYSGTAWLEEESGAPLLLVLTMDSLPRFLDSMTMTFFYTYRDKRTWFTKKIHMEGSGTILFQKMVFRSETVLENHFLYSPPGEKR